MFAIINKLEKFSSLIQPYVSKNDAMSVKWTHIEAYVDYSGLTHWHQMQYLGSILNVKEADVKSSIQLAGHFYLLLAIQCPIIKFAIRYLK